MYTFGQQMGSGIPHLPDVVGICGPPSGPRSEGGFGEARKRCGYPGGSDCLQQVPAPWPVHYAVKSVVCGQH